MHYEKFKKSAQGNMFNHYARNEYELKNRSNECIDIERTHLNYNLAAKDQPLEQNEFMEKRLKDPNLYVFHRKNLNYFATWVITKPQDLNDEQLEPFFQNIYDFFKQEYGVENVVSAYVHMDETTPHMHFCFMPIVKEKTKGFEYKLSARECVKRGDLKRMHSEAQEYLLEKGIECSLITGVTQGLNKSIKELKQEHLPKKVKELKTTIKRLEKDQEQLEYSNKELRQEQVSIKANIQEKQEEINNLDSVIFQKNNAIEELNFNIQTLQQEIDNLSYNDIYLLGATYEIMLEEINDLDFVADIAMKASNKNIEAVNKIINAMNIFRDENNLHVENRFKTFCDKVREKITSIKKKLKNDYEMTM